MSNAALIGFNPAGNAIRVRNRLGTDISATEPIQAGELAGIRTTLLGTVGGLTYLGAIAGASVPAVPTPGTAGGFYIISTAGTSQTKSWGIGDYAIYLGTSGQWQQIKAFRHANVKDFGAVGDGVANDTVAIQAAINAQALGNSNLYNLVQPSGVVLFPAGRFLVSNITLPSGVVLRGEGRDATVIVTTSTTQDCVSLQCVAYPTVVQHFSGLEELSLEGSQTATAGALIAIDGGVDQTNPRFRIRNVSTRFGWNGIRLANTVGGSLERVSVNGARDNGYQQTGSMNSVEFSSCEAQSCSGHGFYLHPNYSSITACFAESNTLDGFHFFNTSLGAATTVLTGCGAELNGRDGLNMDTARGCVVAGFYAAGNVRDGVRLSGVRACTFLGIVVDTSTGWGIYVENGSGGAAPTGNVLVYDVLGGTAGSINDRTGFVTLASQGQYHACWGNDLIAFDWNGGNVVVTAQGKFVARLNGGVAGTDEVQMSHDGTRGLIESKDGNLRLKAPNLAFLDFVNVFQDIGSLPVADGVYDRGSTSFRDRAHWLYRFPFVKKSAVQALAAGGTILGTQGIARVAGSAGSVTLTSTPHIGAGEDGEMMVVQGTNDAATLTLQSSGTLAGSGVRLTTNTIQLGAGDSVTLMYDSTRVLWEEVARALLP